MLRAKRAVAPEPFKVFVCPACGATSTNHAEKRWGHKEGEFWSAAGRCHLGDDGERVEPVEYLPTRWPDA